MEENPEHKSAEVLHCGSEMQVLLTCGQVLWQKPGLHMAQVDKRAIGGGELGWHCCCTS
jgi:hypothetical protein